MKFLRRRLFFCAIAAFMLKTGMPLSVASRSPGALVVSSAHCVRGCVARDEKGLFLLPRGGDEGKTVRFLFGEQTRLLGLREWVSSLVGKECLVLGDGDGDTLMLNGGRSLIWPFGLNASAGLETVDQCEQCVSTLLEYRRLASQDEEALCRRLIESLCDASGKRAVFLFMAPDVACWRGRSALRRDLVCLVGCRLIERGCLDAEDYGFLSTYSHLLPQSLVLPRLLNAVEVDERTQDSARKSVVALLRLRHLIKGKTCGLADMKELVKGHAAEFRKEEVRKWKSLFDSSNREIRKNAGMVFSLLLDQERPLAASLEEEKLFWLRQVSQWVQGAPSP